MYPRLMTKSVFYLETFNDEISFTWRCLTFMVYIITREEFIALVPELKLGRRVR